MRVISIKRLRDFWGSHSGTEAALRAWFKIAEKANWATIAEVKLTYPKTDAVKLDCGIVATIFNIKGNDLRLVVVIEYKVKYMYVKQVMTHAEYDKESWKEKLCND